jgi:NADH:ubiquinone reductase (H+-translocating)
MAENPKRILILGGGFGGVYTARYLEKLLKPSEASIHLVNRENYWVYQPMLPEVISGSIGITDVVSPIRRLCPRTHLVMREVEEIDLKKKVVTVSPGFKPRRMELRYDYLVIALGGVTNFYGMPGMIENAKPFRTLADALALRNHVLHALEEADVESDPDLRAKLLTFVVGGGGFSGVEVVAELNDFIRHVKRNYLRLRDQPVRCVLVHSRDRILPEMTETLALFAQKILRKRGVEIILKDRLAAASSEKAILKSGREIACKTIVSTVPSVLAPVLDKLDCPNGSKDSGGLLVNGNLEFAGYEGEVWALGDCASAKTAAGNPVPPTAQHAVREAETVALNIRAKIAGAPSRIFAFEGLGKLGSLGHFSAVAEILGVRVSGLAAWLLWRGIYLMKMPGIRNKVRIALDWIVALVFPADLVQIKLLRESGIARQHFEAGEIVFNQGDLGDNVYVIETGQCEVLRQVLPQGLNESDGALEHVADLGPGDYFGEMAVLADASRNATVRATAPSDLLLIRKNDFNLLKTSVPAFGDMFRELARTRTKPS